jgi:hypothetical protein
MLHRVRRAPRAPLAVAGLLAFPLFFVSLMAFSLAFERPVVGHVLFKGQLVTVYHTAANGTEAKIWLLALVPALVVVLIGFVATLVPFGTVIPSVASIVTVLLLTSRLDGWDARHTSRFVYGVDLVNDTNSSNNLSRGQWEASAHETASSIGHWTIGLAVVAIALVGLGVVRRRLRKGQPLPMPPPPPEIASGQSQIVRGGLGGP